PDLCHQFPYACSLRLLGNASEVFAPRSSASGFIAVASDDVPLYLRISARLVYEDGHSIGIPDSFLQDYAASERMLKGLWDLFETARAAAADAAGDVRDADKARKYSLAVASVLSALPTAVLVQSLAGTELSQIGEVLDHLARSLEHARARQFVESFVELQ